MKASVIILCCRIYDHFCVRRPKKKALLNQGYPQDNWMSALKLEDTENQDLIMSLLNSNLKVHNFRRLGVPKIQDHLDIPKFRNAARRDAAAYKM